MTDQNQELGLEQDDLIVLVDEDGAEHEFTLLEYLEIEERLYAVLLPEENPEEGAFIFRVDVDENGDDVLMDIEDDDEFAKVVSVLESDDDEE